MSTGQLTCALRGCNKPPWPSLDVPHLTCGNLHHQLLMAGRFNPALPHPYQAILNRNDDGLCALLSCAKPPCSGHSWCSCDHYLLWLTDFTASLHPDQICKLPNCTRHVFVDVDNSPPSQFCGWEHEQKFVMLSALNQPRHQCRHEALPAMEADHPQETSIESECGLVPSLNSLLQSLKKFAHSEIPPTNIRVEEDFYEKHPWEVFTEGHACLLIARLKFTSKGRKLTTKGHYHWKQSGPRAKKSKLYTAKYYTYVKRKGKELKEGDELQPAESSYTMKEYTMEGVKCYSLIQLVLPSSHAKLRKGQPTTHQQQQQQHQCIEVSNIQDFWIDDMDLCIDDIDDMSIYEGLSPLPH